jgi:phospholipid/cholesterol/gamma-HCH transport system substrate-binding protein
MAQKKLAWSEVRVGAFVVMAVLVIAVAIFYVTSSSGAFSTKYRLVTYMPDVDGLTIGAPVDLDGIQVGSVDSIRVNPHPDHDRAKNIEVLLRLRKQFQKDIRSDSTASLVTSGVLGDRYVNITRGFQGSPLEANQDIPATSGSDIRDIEQRGADLTANLDNLVKQVQTIVGDVQHGKGTLGKLVTDPTIANHLEHTSDVLDSLLTNVQAGQGTLGQLVTSDTLYTKMDSALGRADDVFAAVQQQKGTVGKLIYDPALHNQASELLGNGNGLLADARAGKGTLGKLIVDDSLFHHYNEVGANLSQITSKLTGTQSTFGKIINDPKLYDNLTDLTANLNDLVKAFRTDPKKYLHVKFSIF